MDKEKFLSALKDLRNAVFSTEQKFKDAKLKDGTIISYDADDLAIGVPVMAVTEQGKMPLPDGDYEIEDGTLFTCVAGVATAVTPAEAEAEGGEQSATAPAAGEMGEAGKAGAAAAKAIVESIIKETRFSEIVAELETEKEGFKTAKENFTSQKETSEKEITELKKNYETLSENFQKALTLIEQLAELPSDEPAETIGKKFDVKAFKKAYREDLNNLKKTN